MLLISYSSEAIRKILKCLHFFLYLTQIKLNICVQPELGVWVIVTAIKRSINNIKFLRFKQILCLELGYFCLI